MFDLIFWLNLSFSFFIQFFLNEFERKIPKKIAETFGADAMAVSWGGFFTAKRANYIVEVDNNFILLLFDSFSSTKCNKEDDKRGESNAQIKRETFDLIFI